MNDLVQRAAALAEEAHRRKGQVRKFTGEPYIVHPGHVAEIVGSVTSDPVILPPPGFMMWWRTPM